MMTKDRRRTRRVPMWLDAELYPVVIVGNNARNGSVLSAQLTDIGYGGVQVNLTHEEPVGNRFRVFVNFGDRRVEFYTMVKHVAIMMTESSPTYAHGLQITAAQEDVIELLGQMVERSQRTERLGGKRPSPTVASLLKHGLKA